MRGLDGRGSVLRRDSGCRHRRCVQIDCGLRSLGVKLPELEADHLTLRNTEVNACSFTSARHTRFTAHVRPKRFEHQVAASFDAALHNAAICIAR